MSNLPRKFRRLWALVCLEKEEENHNDSDGFVHLRKQLMPMSMVANGYGGLLTGNRKTLKYALGYGCALMGSPARRIVLIICTTERSMGPPIGLAMRSPCLSLRIAWGFSLASCFVAREKSGFEGVQIDAVE